MFTHLRRIPTSSKATAYHYDGDAGLIRQVEVKYTKMTFNFKYFETEFTHSGQIHIFSWLKFHQSSLHMKKE